MQVAAQLSSDADRASTDRVNPFDGGPPIRLQRLLHLTRPGETRDLRRAAFLALTAWVPLPALAAFETLRTGDDTARAFFTDFASYARFLITIPLFIFAERDCIPRLGAVARHFVDSGLVTPAERPRYDAAVQSTQRLLDSRIGEAAAVILSYAIVGTVLATVPASFYPAWHRSTENGVTTLTAPSFWFNLVSVPILLTISFGWIWRIVLWGRFLRRMSLLNLRLIPGHPDCCGGLKFVSSSLRGFRLLACGMGTVFAALSANHIVSGQMTLHSTRNVAIVVVVAVLILAAAPLTVFVGPLRAAKKRGMFLYGQLAGNVGSQFEKKWLEQPGIDRSALEVPDFSATTDLFGIVANVYDMKELPIGWRNLTNLVAAAVVPFGPVTLLALPLKEVFEGLLKLLL
jgi:hypothetical protein